jgi:predicted ester cyclase
MYLAPNMRGMLVHQRQSRIAEKKLRHDQQPNIFFTIQGLLEDVASVAIGCKFDHSTPVGVFFFLQYVKINGKRSSNKPHTAHDLTSLFGSRSSL